MARFTPIYYPESRFGGFTDIDGTLVFYQRVNALASPDAWVVDFGCGRGAFGEDPIPYRREVRRLRGKVARVTGLDVDPAGAENPFVDDFQQLAGPTWPLPDGVIDLVVTDSVVEHLPDPEAFFAEARRVLKPGGHLCIRTANRWSYIALLSRLVPNRYHAEVLDKVKDRIQARDVFPTLYRCNTVPAMRRALSRHGFEHAVYGYEAEPSYLSFSRLAYGLGVLHQKLAPGILRPAIFAFARKLPA